MRMETGRYTSCLSSWRGPMGEPNMLPEFSRLHLQVLSRRLYLPALQMGR